MTVVRRWRAYRWGLMQCFFAQRDEQAHGPGIAERHFHFDGLFLSFGLEAFDGGGGGLFFPCGSGAPE